MTLLQVTKQSVALLRRILEQERDRFAKEDFLLTSSPPAFIYLHARNICELGDDVVALEAGNRSRAARILMRPMLESLFSLPAAVKDPSFPARKIVAEQEDEIERIKIWSEEDHEHDFRDKFQEAKQQICDLRRKPSITEKTNGMPVRLPERLRLIGTTSVTTFRPAATFIPKPHVLCSMNSNLIAKSR
jgi:hypothetical protein